nr:cation diffusion facilitator family transporter [Bacillota bacterium]
AGIGVSGIKSLVWERSQIIIPGAFALIAAIVSIVVKELMFRYTASAAKKISSGALMADAWHHRSDALSSIGSFAGILGAKIGFPALDPLASVVICVFVLKAAVEIFIDAAGKMTDRAASAETVQKIRDITLLQDGVTEIDDLKTRKFGDKIYIDLEISVDGNMPLFEAHAIAERVHDSIEENVPFVKHCMVHVNPASTH